MEDNAKFLKKCGIASDNPVSNPEAIIELAVSKVAFSLADALSDCEVF